MEISHLVLETYFHRRGVRFLDGVDEAGRGPLAGPVVAAACLIPESAYGYPEGFLEGVKDSKALTPKARKNIFWTVISQTVAGVGMATEREIDELNILNASRLAMRRAILSLPITPDLALIDGNVKVDLPIDQLPVIEGDRRILSISAASIVAKVTRDEMMLVCDAEYPAYGFRVHKGYPTRAHVECLTRLGPSPIHRKTFGPVEKLLEPSPL